MKNIEKFLEFNGKRISILNADGTWWVAVKPICEALGVDFEKQRERINRHPILSQLPTKRGVVAADGKIREMLCLPEMYIFGWLFCINSDNLILLEYQQKCYEVLYNHFNGLLSGRIGLLSEKTQEDLREKELLEKLGEDPLFQELQNIKSRRKQTMKGLRNWDEQLKGTQGSLFS